MPKFTKTESELETHFDKWLFVLKNLPKLDRIPVTLREKIFLKLFETAEIAKLSPEEYQHYESSMNAYREVLNIQSTSFEKGEKIGLEKGKKIGIEKEKIDVAIKMLNKGLDVALIKEITGLIEEEIKEIKEKLIE